MAKAHRGAGIRSMPFHGRGTCPICKRDRVKVLYDSELDGQKVKICKICTAALKNKARREKPAAVPAGAVAESAE